jgi:hypothetical protein
LKASEELDGVLQKFWGKEDAAIFEVAESDDDTGCAVDEIGFVGRVLVAEPEGNPTAVGSARCTEEVEPLRNPGLDAGLEFVGKLGKPRAPSAERVSRQIGRTSIEGQGTPASAEGGDPTVAVLESE